MKKAIFLFNRSRHMLQPWLNAGYECWTFDGQLKNGVHNPEPGLFEVGMWFDASATSVHANDVARIVGGGVKFIASFAECTYLTTTGARWLYHPEDRELPIAERRPHPAYPNRRRDMEDAVKLAKFVELVEAYCHIVNGDFSTGPIPWMLENPARSFLPKLWRNFNHTFNPCDYGGYIPECEEMHPDYPGVIPDRDAYTKLTGIWCSEAFVMPEPKPVEPVGKDFNRAIKVGGKSTRTKNIRSATPRGFAMAVFEANHRA